MSEETASWLNTMTLIGFTEQRRHRWALPRRRSTQGAQPLPGSDPRPGLPAPVRRRRRRRHVERRRDGRRHGVQTFEVRDTARKATPRRRLGRVRPRPPTRARSWASSSPATRAMTTRNGCSDRSPRSSTTTSRWLGRRAEAPSHGCPSRSPNSITTPEGVQFRPAAARDDELRRIAVTVQARRGERRLRQHARGRDGRGRLGRSGPPLAPLQAAPRRRTRGTRDGAHDCSAGAAVGGQGVRRRLDPFLRAARTRPARRWPKQTIALADASR